MAIRLATVFWLGIIMTASSGEAQERGLRPAAPPSAASALKGRDYALLFGTGQYDDPAWPALVNPKRDAQTIASELESTYGFTVDVVEDAPLTQMLAKLESYLTRDFADNDQLFIFFAGHGFYRPQTDLGYIVARDSRDPAADTFGRSFLSFSDLYRIVTRIPSKHIFLVMDVCHGGTFGEVMRGGAPGTEYGDAALPTRISRVMQRTTRKYLTSGGNEYVPDGSGRHSPFAYRFIEALRSPSADGLLTTVDIITRVRDVQPNTPVWGQFAGDEPRSDFVFLTKAASAALASAPAPPAVRPPVAAPPPAQREAPSRPVPNTERAAPERMATRVSPPSSDMERLKRELREYPFAWMSCDETFCRPSLEGGVRQFPAVTALKFGESATKLNRSLPLAALAGTPAADHLIDYGVPYRPGSAIFVQLAFADGTVSDVRQVDMTVLNGEPVGGVRVEAAQSGGPTLFIGFKASDEELTVIPDVPYGAASVSYAIGQGPFLRAESIDAGKGFRFTLPIADVSIRVQVAQQDGKQIGPFRYEIRNAREPMLQAYKAAFRHVGQRNGMAPVLCKQVPEKGAALCQSEPYSSGGLPRPIWQAVKAVRIWTNPDGLDREFPNANAAWSASLPATTRSAVMQLIFYDGTKSVEFPVKVY